MKSRALISGKHRQAFTLIELLVVIAIIAILAAILFPVFAQARDKARQASCLSNNKQLANAMMMYSQDYDETVVYWNPSDAYPMSRWQPRIHAYIKNNDVWACPSSKLVPVNDPLIGRLAVDYIANYHLMHPVGGQAWRAPVALATLEYPAETAWAAESAPNPKKDPAICAGLPCDGYNFGFAWQGDPRVNRWGFPHAGGGNFCFMDGHAKWYKMEAAINNVDKPGGIRTRAF